MLIVFIIVLAAVLAAGAANVASRDDYIAIGTAIASDRCGTWLKGRGAVPGDRAKFIEYRLISWVQGCLCAANITKNETVALPGAETISVWRGNACRRDRLTSMTFHAVALWSELRMRAGE